MSINIEPLSAEQASLCAEDESRVSLQRVLRQHCEAIRDGHHKVNRVMTEEEARRRFENELRTRTGWQNKVVFRRNVTYEDSFVQNAWAYYSAALRDVGMIKEG